jgi:hypothetical protein
MKRFFMSSCIAVLAVFLGVSGIHAKSATSCYDGNSSNTVASICATVSVPDCVEPDKDFDVSVEGSSEGRKGEWSVSDYSFYENAEYDFVAYHSAHVTSGILIDEHNENESGLFWGDTYSNTYTMNKPAGTYKFTFIFGARSETMSYYDAAADIYIDFAAVSTDVPLDIKPGSCPNPLNVNKKGVLSAAIVGTVDFDVTHIDVSSVTLAGVSPIHHSIRDVTTPYYFPGGERIETDCSEDGPDGFADLTLKFDAQEVVQALETSLNRELVDREVLLISINGNVIGGGDCASTISGEDVIWIIKNQ